MINNKYNIDDYVMFLNKDIDEDRYPFGRLALGKILSISLEKRGILYGIKSASGAIIENGILGIQKDIVANYETDKETFTKEDKERYEAWSNNKKTIDKYKEILKESKEKVLLSLKEELKLSLKEGNLIIEEDNNKKE